MLQITVPASEMWDEESETFVYGKERTLLLEHSLVSISKWESKWKKAFLDKREKTQEEILDYIKCMTLTSNVGPEVYNALTNENLRDINDYIEDPMTATCFYDDSQGGRSRETVTSELIYYWMIALDIPFECQKWPLNRLLTLVRICNIKNQPAKKMSRTETLSRNAALNAARRERLNTKG